MIGFDRVFENFSSGPHSSLMLKSTVRCAWTGLVEYSLPPLLEGEGEE